MLHLTVGHDFLKWSDLESRNSQDDEVDLLRLRQLSQRLHGG